MDTYAGIVLRVLTAAERSALSFEQFKPNVLEGLMHLQGIELPGFPRIRVPQLGVLSSPLPALAQVPVGIFNEELPPLDSAWPRVVALGSLNPRDLREDRAFLTYLQVRIPHTLVLLAPFDSDASRGAENFTHAAMADPGQTFYVPLAAQSLRGPYALEMKNADVVPLKTFPVGRGPATTQQMIATAKDIADRIKEAINEALGSHSPYSKPAASLGRDTSFPRIAGERMQDTRSSRRRR